MSAGLGGGGGGKAGGGGGVTKISCASKAKHRL